jgi:hypothetical protein
MVDPRCPPAVTRAQEAAFVEQCSFAALQKRLPLRWPRAHGIPDSPKKRYRSYYVSGGWGDLYDLARWEHLSDFELLLRLVDFGPLRPLLAHLLGWESAQGRVPFDPVSTFLFLGWQLVNGWSRAEALRNLKKPRYRDYAWRFGYLNGDFPTEGAIRYFLTTIGSRSQAHGETVSVPLDERRAVQIAIQLLNHLLAGAVALVRAALLVPAHSWQAALLGLDGMIHDAASCMRCAFVQESCYQPTSPQAPRPCPAKERGVKGCECDTLRCRQVCAHAPVRDPQARSVYYAGTNQPRPGSPDTSIASAEQEEGAGELRYGYRSLALQFADSLRRFSLVLLDDFRPANGREENPGAALLLQLAHFYPELGIAAVAADAGLGYYAFLHTIYQLGARRVVDLRADRSDKEKAQWTLRGYDEKGRPICPYGYALTANGFDADRQRHKWFCGQACLNGHSPRVQLAETSYPPDECPYQDPQRPHGKIVNVGETFEDGSIRLARDLPVGTPTWKRLYHRARNATEARNAALEAWGLKRMSVYGQERGRAMVALADTWLNLTTLARLVREATFASQEAPG